jgi:hypothetical protein
MQKGTTSKGMEANKNFAKWLSCGIQISGTFGLHHVHMRQRAAHMCKQREVYMERENGTGREAIIYRLKS